jgi:hypothetical protein
MHVNQTRDIYSAAHLGSIYSATNEARGKTPAGSNALLEKAQQKLGGSESAVISEKARQLQRADQLQRSDENDMDARKKASKEALKQAAADDELNTEEQREVQQLRARDREVRAHEQAHVAASGSIGVSGPRYSYEDGPDGKRYAVGGSVNFQVPPANSPAEEIRLAAQLRRMALAPANPSGTDRAVAADASRKEAQARRELQQENMEKAEAARSSSEDGKDELKPVVASSQAKEMSDEQKAFDKTVTTDGIDTFVDHKSDSDSGITSMDLLSKNKQAQAYANASSTGLLQYSFSVNFTA